MSKNRSSEEGSVGRPHAAKRPMATAMPEGVEDVIRHVEGMRWTV